MRRLATLAAPLAALALALAPAGAQAASISVPRAPAPAPAAPRAPVTQPRAAAPASQPKAPVTQPRQGAQAHVTQPRPGTSRTSTRVTQPRAGTSRTSYVRTPSGVVVVRHTYFYSDWGLPWWHPLYGYYGCLYCFGGPYAYAPALAGYSAPSWLFDLFWLLVLAGVALGVYLGGRALIRRHYERHPLEGRY